VTYLPFNSKMKASCMKVPDYADPEQLVVMPDGAMLELVEQLQDGGQGTVHKARRLDYVGDGEGCVAVKVPKMDMTGDLDEAAADWTVLLREELRCYMVAGPHPNIIKVRQAPH
jgi:hypothetical protein